jgi:hypothetical protein
MDPEEFLKLGEELVERKTACGCRAAIGRAYYGVLMGTIELMKSAGISPPKQNEIHQKTWQDLLNCGVPELAGPGSELASLHGQRIQADYQMDNVRPEQYQNALYWVRLAREHYDIIKATFVGSKRQTLIEGIRVYRQKVGRPL